MFAVPAAFWGLVFIGPALLFFYLFRQQTKVYVVPSILHILSLPEAQFSSRKRLRRFVTDPLFYIQLFLFLYLLSALATPIFEQRVRQVAVVIDVTASMQTKEGEKDRLDIAKAKAELLIRSMNENDKVIILSAGRNVNRVSSLNTSRIELIQTLRSIPSTDTGGSISAAVYTAANLLLQNGGGEIVVFTDTAFEPPDFIDQKSIGLRVEGIGTQRQNVAIVSIQSPSHFLSKTRHLVAQIRNFGRDSFAADISLSIEGKLIEKRKLDFLPRGVNAVSFDVSGKSGLAHIELHHEDPLKVDNQAYTFLSSRKRLNLLSVSSGRGLDTFLTKIEAFKIISVQPGSFNPSQRLSTSDIHIFNRWTPSQVPGGNNIFIFPTADTKFFRVQGKTSSEIYYWDEDHPFIDQVVLDNLRFDECVKIDLLRTADIAISSRESPMLASFENESTRSVVCTLPLDTMLHEPSAVLLLFKMLEWASPLSQRSSVHFDAGAPINCSFPKVFEQIQIVHPDGEISIHHPKNNRYIFNKTNRAGPYRILGQDFDKFYIASVPTSSESDLSQPAKSYHFTDLKTQRAMGKTQGSYTPLILKVALVLLALEWWFFFFRKKRLEVALQ